MSLNTEAEEHYVGFWNNLRDEYPTYPLPEPGLASHTEVLNFRALWAKLKDQTLPGLQVTNPRPG